MISTETEPDYHNNIENVNMYFYLPAGQVPRKMYLPGEIFNCPGQASSR